MGFLSVKPNRLADVQRELTLHNVGDEPQWVGYNDRFVYVPVEPTKFAPRQVGSVMLNRFAFNVDRPIVGTSRRVTSEALGHAALFGVPEDDELQLSIIVPTKTGIMTPVVEELLVQGIPRQRQDDGAIHTAVAAAIFEVVQRTDS